MRFLLISFNLIFEISYLLDMVKLYFGYVLCHSRTIKKAIVHSFNNLEYNIMVGTAGFEPTTSRSQSECTTKLCYAPI